MSRLMVSGRFRRAAVAGAMATCAATLGTPASADEFISPSLARGSRLITNILVLPPQVTIVRVGLRGGEPRPVQSAELERELAPLIDRAVRERVWNARVTAIEPPTMPEDRYAIADIQQRYDRIAQVMHRKRRDVGKGRYSLTDAVVTGRSVEPGTMLMFTRFSALTTTLAAQLLLANAYGELFVAFADAITGEILFLSKRKIPLSTNTGQILGQLREAFKRIPRERFAADRAAPSEWAVVHLHTIGGPCEGWLYLLDGKLGFRPLKKTDHAWEAPLADVEEVADAIGYGFHVKLRDGRNFRLAGKGIGKNQLLALIAANRK